MLSAHTHTRNRYGQFRKGIFYAQTILDVMIELQSVYACEWLSECLNMQMILRVCARAHTHIKAERK